MIVGEVPADQLPEGWRPQTRGPEELATDSPATAEGSLGAILWDIPSAGPMLEGQIRSCRNLLAKRGRLLVMAPSPPDGHLGPNPLTSRLAEGGLALLKDLPLQTDGLLQKDGPAEKLHRLLVARPDPVRIRGFRTGDGQRIVSLFHACFHPHRDLEHWRWKYEDNPYGRHLISLAVDGQDDALAHYAGYPCPFHGGGNGTTLCVQMGDTMVHPGYRGAGRRSTSLLGRAVEHFFAAYSTPEVAFYYGFNTGNIRKFSQRFVRGEVHGSVPLRRLESEGFPAITASRAYRVRQVQSPGLAWDRFFRRVAPTYGPMLRRDHAYVDWRYRRCPDTDYLLLTAHRWGRLVAWGAFRRMEGGVMAWVDALCDPRHPAAESLLAAALASPQMRGVDAVEAWFPEDPPHWHQQLLTLGFEARKNSDDLTMIYRVHGGQDLQERFARLYYTMGDGDLY